VVLLVRMEVVVLLLLLLLTCLLLLLLLLLLLAHLALLLHPLFEVHFGVALLLVAAREFASAHVARERFFAGVGSNVRRQVVRPREGPHTDPALERLLARVDADVAGEFVRTRETPVTVLYWARVRPLVHRRLARPVRVLAGFHRN
jgi:hypothetical protein